MADHVEGLEEAVELAQSAMRELRLSFPMDEPPTPQEEADAAVKAAATAIREERRCESCEDTGIYEEGSEWAPCGECELGRGFLERLQVHAEEIRNQERQRIRETLEALPPRGLYAQGRIDRQAALDSLTKEGS